MTGGDAAVAAEGSGTRVLGLIGSGRWGNHRATLAGSLVGVAVLGVLAVPRLGATPLWLDEAYTLGVVNQFAYGVKSTGGTMVAYYAPLWVWAHVSESTVWLRTLSLVFAAAVMPVVALIGKRVGGTRLAVLAPPLLAASFMFQTLAVQLRAYSLEILILSVSFYALIRAVQQGTDTPGAHRWWVLLTLVAPWGVFAHGLFPIHLAAIGVAALLSPKPRQAVVRLLPMLGASAVMVALLFWLGISSVGAWVQPTTLEGLKYVTFRYLGLDHVLQAVSIGATVIVVWAAVQARRRTRRGTDEERSAAWVLCLPFIWAVVPSVSLLATSVVRPEFVDRYLAGIAPGVALLIGLGLCRGFDWLATRTKGGQRVATGGVGVAGVIIVLGFALVGVHQVRREPHSNWDQVASVVARKARSGDGMLLYSDLSRPTFERQWSLLPHGAVPRLVNQPRQLGAVKRVDRLDPLDYSHRRRLLAFRRVWTVTVADGGGQAEFYQDTPPLTTNYRVARTWHFQGMYWPITLRLYERTTPVDFHPAAD